METNKARVEIKITLSDDDEVHRIVEGALNRAPGSKDVDNLNIFTLEEPAIPASTSADEKTTDKNGVEPLVERFSLSIPTTFFSMEDGLFCQIGNRLLAMDKQKIWKESISSRTVCDADSWKADTWEEWRVLLDASNRKLGLKPSKEAQAEITRGVGQGMTELTLSSSDYDFQTGLESDWLLRGASYGSSGYRKDLQRGVLVHEELGASHRVELREEAPMDGDEALQMDTLEWLATKQSADFSFAFFYICRLLAPPSPLPSNLAAVGWIDLDDVAEKIGYDVNGSTATQREELRAQVWQFLLFGSRALVIGQRTNYSDRATGEKIETRIESPVWRILDKERPVQTAMFGETPRRVQLLISKAWEPLLTTPQLAQYLPFAQVVGSIPTNQPGGAWARVLGMALANFWRRLPHEATGVAPLVQPTRRELLIRYKPKKNPPLEILAGSNPKRAVKYWHDAIGILAERGFIAADGEAARTVEQMLEPFGRKGWQNHWLDERVDLQPGSIVIDAIRERAAEKPLKIRALATPKRRGRPKQK